MKKVSKNIFVIPAVVLICFIVIMIILDIFVMPYYVSADEYTVPNVVGMKKDQAIQALKDANLNPIIHTSRYDERFGKDYVMFQKPSPNTTVKVNRRVYLTISGGLQTVKMPFLINKSVRDAQVTLERLGFVLGSIEEVKSEFPSNIVVEQEYSEGKELPQGTPVSIKVSIGPQIGMIRVPNILGRSLAEAENILKINSLKIGLRTFIHSSTLLPNTIVDQQPSENTLISIGDSINVVITKNK